MSDTKKIKSLQGLRFIAFLAIFIWHISVVRETINYASIAVSLFFILSGFVSSISIDKYKNSFRDMFLYLKNKLKRIYPLYLVSIIIYLPVSLSMIFKYGIVSVEKYVYCLIASFLMLQSWVVETQYITLVAGVGWFLSVLIFLYYITIPLYNFILHFNKENRLLINIITILCLLLIVSIYSYIVPKNGYFNYYFPIYRMFEYLIGMIVWNIYVKIKDYNISNIIVTIVEFISVIVLVLMPIIKVINLDYIYIGMNALLLLAISLGNGVVGKILSNKVFVWLGSMTFEMYLLHFTILIYLFNIWKMFVPITTISTLIYVIVAMVITIMISYIIHYKIGGLLIYGKTRKNKKFART